jgi:hypothetical protein
MAETSNPPFPSIRFFIAFISMFSVLRIAAAAWSDAIYAALLHGLSIAHQEATLFARSCAGCCDLAVKTGSIRYGQRLNESFARLFDGYYGLRG